MYILGKIFKYSLAAFFIAEALSFVGYLEPSVNTYVFLGIVAAVSAISIRHLDIALLVLFAELFIGSKGYLFFLDIGSEKISIRIALWFIIMASWSGQAAIKAIREKKLDLPILRSPLFPYLAALFLLTGWGLFNGFVNHNTTANIFFDFNGWLYFVLVFPVYQVFHQDRENIFLGRVMSLLAGSSLWLSFKTFFLLYVFTHDFASTYGIYRWVRQTGVGEITPMQDGFFRVFIQSQIFILIAFFLFLILFADKLGDNGKKARNYFFISSAYLSAILISMSRSFWFGLAAGAVILSVYAISKRWQAKKYLISLGSMIILSGLSIAILFAIARFPFPAPLTDFNASLFSDRALQVTGEAGASSRWALLPVLKKKIAEAPILGTGFGSTVTYNTRDPRILEKNPTGEYTTFAFEWGWLDIWIKIGFFGLLAYAVLLARVAWRGVKNGDLISWSLSIGIIVLAAVSFFSPYTNHPLGIGYLLFASLAIEKMAIKKF